MILSFKEALVDSLKYSRRHVLLGNGFSIACRPDIFVYGKLFDRADFSKLSPSVKKAFKALSTHDFERVIKALKDAKMLLKIYEGTNAKILKTMQKDADGLREVLVQTIADSHPSRPSEIKEEEYEACKTFLLEFNTTYSLNYDLLLYWVQMNNVNRVKSSSDDGFRKPEDDLEADYVTWESENSHEQNTWFLHGALHIFDTGTEVQKYTWVNTGVRLIDQIRSAVKKDYFPLFVAEGSSKEKRERIRHSDYLAKAHRSFKSIQGALFIYGHSLAENDEHCLRCIERGKVTHVYVGLYGDPDSNDNKAIILRANKMANVRKNGSLTVSFYDSATARVWGK